MDLANPIVLDFETYYESNGYGLKLLTTEAYIRDPEKFQCIAVDIYNPKTQRFDFFWGETWIDHVKKLIADNPESPVVAHNATFDGGILGLRYGIHPKYILCTKDMAQVAGVHYVTGSLSLDRLSNFLRDLGVNIKPKGSFVADMDGVRLEDMTEDMRVKYAAYCHTDTVNCLRLYEFLLEHITVDELYSINVTKQMFCAPRFILDSDLLQDYAVQLQQERDAVLQRVMDIFGLEDFETMLSAMRSRTKFPKLLEKLGVEVPKKYSEKQMKMVPALAKTDEGLIALLSHPDPDVRATVDVKLNVGSSQEMTRTDTFLDVASRGSLPVPLGHAYARTQRYGGMDKINLQNLRKRTGEPIHRRSICAPPGFVILSTDSSQIEARLLAFAAQQMDLVNIFVNGLCPYSDMAGTIYNTPAEEVYRLAKEVKSSHGIFMRQVGKMVVLGCGYGMGVARFRESMVAEGLEEAAEMSEHIINVYRSKNPRIKGFWKTAERALEVMMNGGSVSFGGPHGDLFFADGSHRLFGEFVPSIRLPNGLWLRYKNLRYVTDDDGRHMVYDHVKYGRDVPTKIYGAKLVENLIQALAFAVMKYQANNIHRAGVPINLNVHDEWASVVRYSDAAATATIHGREMRRVPPYVQSGLLNCEVEIGINYSDGKHLQGF